MLNGTYKHNDIILNFYRGRAYRFNPENIDHLKDLSRCRLANFKEIESFEALEKTQKIIYLKDLGINKKWNFQNTIEIQITDKLMRKLIDVSKEAKTKDYQLLINYYLNATIITPDIKELQNKNKQLKQVIKDFKKYVQNIKL